jgi:MFS family permease
MELERDFWLMWAGSALSNLGDGVRLTALPLMAASLSRDPLDVAAVAAASMAPWVVLGPLGGAIVDRVDRKRLIGLGQLVRGAAVAAFAGAVLTDRASLAMLYALAFVIGAGEVVVDSAAQAAIPQLAGPDELERANSRFIAAEVVTNNVLGGPLGGVLFAVAMAAPFGVDAATFFGGLVLVLMVKRPLQGARREAKGIGADIREGFSYLWGSDVLRNLALAVGAFNLAVTAATSLLVLLVLDDLGSTGAVFGIIGGVGAVGGVIGSLVTECPVHRFGRRPVMVVSTLLVGAGCAVVGAAAGVVAVTTGVAITNLGVSGFNVVGRALRQRLVPDRLLGRVVASFRIIGLGAVPVGALLGGWFAAATSVRATFGSAVVAALVVAWRLRVVLAPWRVERELDGLE